MSASRRTRSPSRPDGRRAIVTNYGTTGQPGRTVSLLDLEQPREIDAYRSRASHTPARRRVVCAGSRRGHDRRVAAFADPRSRRASASSRRFRRTSRFAHGGCHARRRSRVRHEHRLRHDHGRSTCRAPTRSATRHGRGIGSTRPVTGRQRNLGRRAGRGPGHRDRCVDARDPPPLCARRRADPDRTDARWPHGTGELRRDWRSRRDRHAIPGGRCAAPLELPIADVAKGRGAAASRGAARCPSVLPSLPMGVPSMSRRPMADAVLKLELPGSTLHRPSPSRASPMASVALRCCQSSNVTRARNRRIKRTRPRPRQKNRSELALTPAFPARVSRAISPRIRLPWPRTRIRSIRRGP